MKLSKPQIKLHKECEAILKKEVLTYDEKYFVYENWFPAFNNQVGIISSYFTPMGLANDLRLHISGERIIDLCAGIGILTFNYYHISKSWDGIECEVICIERNPEFVEVGKKLFPEATWICADVLDQNIYKDLGHFNTAVSNPPFGKIKTDNSDWLKYKCSEFEYKVIEIGTKISDFGAYIVGADCAPFRTSGPRSNRIEISDKYIKFTKETGIVLNANIGIDCDIYIDNWKGVSPKVEIVTVNMDELEDYSAYIKY